MYLNITLTKQVYLRCLLLSSFLYAQKKALGVMDQSLRGRSHHELVNSFAKKEFREITKDQSAYQSSRRG